MFIYPFKIIIVFPILFFLIIRPMNEFLLRTHLVPYLNDLFLSRLEINFDYSIDNLIFKLNSTSHYYSLPFNEYYVMFFVIFFSKIFLKKYLHFHLLNFTLILLAPFFYYCISFNFYTAFKLLSIIQNTINFYFLITIIFYLLTIYGPKSFKMKQIKSLS